MSNILEILGTKYDPDQDLKDNLKAAKLASWNVRNVPVFAVMSDRDIPLDRSAIIRTSPHDRTKRDVLGETKGRFELLTNELMATQLQDLKEALNRSSSAGLEFHSLGEMDEGRKVFMALYSSEWDIYLLGMMSYDQTLPTSIRLAKELPGGGLMNLSPWCGLTTEMTFNEPVERILALSSNFWTSVQELANHHSTPAYDRPTARTEIEVALGLPEGIVKPSTLSRYRNKSEQVLRYLPEKESGFTRWELLSALCAWADFSAPVRGAKLGELKTQRAEQGLIRPYRKQDAFNRLFNQ